MTARTRILLEPTRNARWRAWLLLLALPMACDRNPAAPASPFTPAEGLQIGFPVPSFPVFDSSQYFPIDVQLAVQQQYGSAYTAVQVSNHLYGWRAKYKYWTGGLYSIDMARAVRDQYGSGYVLGAVGAGINDWRAVHWSALVDAVLPVMPIASDYFFNVDSVAWGLANLRSVLVTIRNWYALRMTLYGGPSKTFRLLRPLVVFLQSSRTAAQWNALSYSTTDDLHRYDFMYAVDSEYQRAYPVPGGVLRVAIVPFTGNSPDVWLGAADQAAYAVAPPRATSVSCPPTGPLDYRCSDATYAIGHELGHGFSLHHSCDTYPSDTTCSNSIMQTGKPWDAILLPGEVNTLQTSPFFF
jgi:hypothetical protein